MVLISTFKRVVSLRQKTNTAFECLTWRMSYRMLRFNRVVTARVLETHVFYRVSPNKKRFFVLKVFKISKMVEWNGTEVWKLKQLIEHNTMLFLSYNLPLSPSNFFLRFLIMFKKYKMDGSLWQDGINLQESI